MSSAIIDHYEGKLAECADTLDRWIQQAAKMEAQRDNLLAELKELYAVVLGECPSLLNEDSGGASGHDGRIRAAIAKAEGKP